MTTRQAIRTLLALHIVRGWGLRDVRAKVAGVLVWGWRERHRPATQFIDPRILEGTMSWDDPDRLRAP